MTTNKSKAKGSRAETVAKDFLRKHTGLNWQRTPQSGALAKEHCLKGDIYIPQEKNIYTIEVKHYKDSSISHLLLTSTKPKLEEWWEQAIREANENGNDPLLIFKHDRSKLFVAGYDCFSDTHKSIYLPHLDLNIMILEEWLKYKPEFIK